LEPRQWGGGGPLDRTVGGPGRVDCPSVGTILVVCTGNICRSPMAEGLLRHHLEARGIGSIRVQSAGVQAWDGDEAMPEAVQALREVGLDISGHLSRALDPASLESADLILAMARWHRDVVAHLDPRASARTFTLKELVSGLDAFPGHSPEAATADERLGEAVRWASQRRASGEFAEPQDIDVPDPLGLSVQTFRAVAWEIDLLCGALIDSLFGEEWREVQAVGEVAM
jgi:protein-tyrosine phosphatase